MPVTRIIIATLFAALAVAPPRSALTADLPQPQQQDSQQSQQDQAQPAPAPPAPAPPAPAPPAPAPPAQAARQAQGTIFTLWPLLDYRTSPAEGYSNISILGPFIKFQQKGDDKDSAIRPFFYRKDHLKDRSTSTYFLYPAAFHENTPDADTYEIFRLFQVSNFRKEEGAKRNGTAMLLPFYVAGESEKRGKYRAFIPFYGDIYDRFWRDEYHMFMFPIYGSTVKGTTTTRHYLWPFFSTTTGENETGWEFFPLYGQSEKTGVYKKKFVLWPFYVSGTTGLNTDNPTEKSSLLPVYARTDSPKVTSRSYMWPFFGYTDDRGRKQKSVDYFWPFIYTVRGEKRNTTAFLPLFEKDVYPGGEKDWYLWPILKHDKMRSDIFNEDEDRILFFLYRDKRESWPKDGSTRRRTVMWPLFLYNKSPHGVYSISLPAPVESVLDKEGIEENWAPLWRLYQHRWDDEGNSVTSFLWNLFWEEKRGPELAYELFPLISYRSTTEETDLKLLKGLVSVKRSGPERGVYLFWLPFGLKWGGT